MAFGKSQALPEALADESKELDIMLAEHPALQVKLNMMQSIWNEKHIGFAIRKEEAFNKHMQRLSNHFSGPVLQYDEADEIAEVEPARRSFFNRRRIAWSAAAAAVIVIAWFSFLRPGKTSIEGKSLAKNTISTKRGSKSKVQLPDGTQVWLNAESKIVYNESFQGKIREVQLTGEAFFDVVRDESRPFIIHTNTIDVKVLGTAFNVRSYANEKNTETSLIRGLVEVTLRDNPDKKIILKPNEKLVVPNRPANENKAGAQDTKKLTFMLGRVNYQLKDSSVIETLWVKNNLAFDNESLEDIALKIERWFDVKVTITKESLKQKKYSGFFEEEDLPQILEALKLAAGDFNYSINKKEVKIFP